ncbi:hypothetical protein CDL12_11031 [Handroanthus impetiginosus]|uniref:Dof zinc finger protein n=1 Tax=Handroanthus impetiginosus TaxID=429701 RepID=A0A2G9HFL0_9LAMI|nr:hypothetical protein CDL12_11031 [Handroanthus impetiginosus]
MGLSTKQVSGDQGLDWGPQSGEAELSKPPSMRRQQLPQQQPEPLKCPRCGSTNTKFCYYNNYNKSQPRHFCKSCKRHWTKGGTLRNVPVGGGRKNKRPKISNCTTTTAATTPRHQDLPCLPQSDQKSISNNILYQALIRSSSSTLLHETTKGINVSIPMKPFMGSNETNSIISTGLNASSITQDRASEFQFSSLSTFDMNPSLIPTSYQSLSHYTVNLDSVEESTITTVNIPSTSSGPWPGLDTSGGLELPNNWNWNEIDALTSADDLNISWDGDDGDGDGGVKIKP